jgi:O-antigen/teichoic acid export membrane protein
MLTEKLLKMASQLLMLVLMARVLAPDDLGQLMYCFALASIFLFLNQLGLDTLLVKKFVDHIRKKQSLLWHAFAARLLAGLLSIVLINTLGLWLVDAEHRHLLFIISLYHLFLPFSTFEWFFQAEGRSDLAAIGLICGHMAGFVLRLWCVLTTADLAILASAYVLEVAITGLVYVFLIRQQQIQVPTAFSRVRMQRLTQEALPLMISGAVILIYMKVDQLMLGLLSSAEEVAYYVAATRLSEAWYFVGLTVISVYFPKLLNLKRKYGKAVFVDSFVKLGRIVFWSAVFISVATFIVSDDLIELLYGNKYSKSAGVLSLTICAVPFVYLGALSTRLSIENNDKRTILLRAFISVTLCVGLNIILIPMFGAVGAAISSLMSQIFSGALAQIFILKGNNYISTVIFRIVFLIGAK